MSTKVCVPIMGQDRKTVLEQAEKVSAMKPDIIELRADYLDESNRRNIAEILNTIKKNIGNIKLVFTFRTKAEGGQSEISVSDYENLCLTVAPVCDYVDVEVTGYFDVAKKMIPDIQRAGAKVIGSNHHFDRTPDDEEIIEIMKRMESAGADICKMAVMPQVKEDVERFMKVSEKLKDMISVRIITMSMGELGSISRVCTKQTGSCITFATGIQSSAPGQIDITMARKLIKINQGCHLKGNIVLIGFMGTGKTTVSKALSAITGFQEIDTDAYIVKQQGRSISEIFEKEGEAFFRNLETNALKDISEKEGQIISCGGGAVLRDENVKILKEKGIIILLTATPETVFERVKDHTHRPILNSDMSLEHIKELMSQREPRYQEVADVIVNVDANDRVLTCYHIITELEKRGYLLIP